MKKINQIFSLNLATTIYLLVVNLIIVNVSHAGPFTTPDGRYLLKTVYFPSDFTKSKIAILNFPVPPGTDTEVVIPTADNLGQQASYTAQGMSSTRQRILFSTRATNLIVGQTPSGEHLYVYDTLGNTNTRMKWITRPLSGSAMQVCDEDSECSEEVSIFCSEISSDGRYVSFVTDATNLVSGQAQNGNFYKWYIHDILSNTTKLIVNESESSFLPYNCKISIGFKSGGGGNVTITFGGYGSLPTWSGNSTFRNSSNSRIDSPSANGVYLYDIDEESMSLVSLSTEGEPGDRASGRAFLTEDAQYLIFESTSTNLVSDDTNNTSDIFRRNLESGVTERVSLDPNGQQLNAFNILPFTNSNGTAVVYTSLAARPNPSTRRLPNRARQVSADLTTNTLMYHSFDSNTTEVLATTGITEEDTSVEYVINDDGIVKASNYVFDADEQEYEDITTVTECLQDTACADSYKAPAPIVSVKRSGAIVASVINPAPTDGFIQFKIKSGDTKRKRLVPATTLKARFASLPSGNYKVSYIYKDSGKRTLAKSKIARANIP